MKMKRRRQSIAAIAGTTVIATLGAVPAAQASANNIFLAKDIGNGYLLAGTRDAEGKCGEGKCGATDEAKDTTEGKCGEDKGNATEDKGAAEGKCGASDESKDETEGKCGEGKCGSAV